MVNQSIETVIIKFNSVELVLINNLCLVNSKKSIKSFVNISYFCK